MDIGRQIRTITVEPLEAPMRRDAPAPDREPAPCPAPAAR